MRTQTNIVADTEGSSTTFFALTFLISLPLYLLNALAFYFEKGELGGLLIALLTLTPITSACILTYRSTANLSKEKHGVKELLKRCLDRSKIPSYWWYALVLFLPPLFFAISLTICRYLLKDEVTIPPPMTPLVALPALFVVCVILAACEEVGWMGYAFQE